MFIKPDLSWAEHPYIQADKEGKIKAQNKDLTIAINSAIDSGWAVWEKETGLMLYPYPEEETATIIKVNLLHSIVATNIKVPLLAKVSENFTYQELMDRTNKEIILCPELLSITQQARTQTGYSIQTSNGLSWYRSPEFNESIGGASGSLHTLGQAHDSKWWSGGQQVHPLHTAYVMEDLAKKRNLFYEIGVYFPYYDNSFTGGYLHFGIRTDRVNIYSYDSNGKKSYHNRLSDISMFCRS